jgi:uncharacterized protein (TIGR03663 family)
MATPNRSLNIKEALILLLILAAAFAFRVYHIELRPLHHDEGVNFHFLKGMDARGYYAYSHENYHGPLFFYLSKFFLNLFGENELGLRMSSIVSGAALVALPFLVLSTFGFGFAVLAALFLCISTSMVFHSRYSIHEMMFALTSIWFGIASFKWFSTKERSDLYQLFVALSLMITIKETFVISGAATLIGLLFCFSPRQVFETLRSNIKNFGGPLIAFIILLLGTFSGGFRWFGGIYEMFLAVPQWIGRGSGDTGHFKPFLFYSQVLLQTEPWLVLALVVAAALFIFSLLSPKNSESVFIKIGRDSALRFLLGLSLGFWGIYGVVSYKTVWLIISQSSAMIILLARLIYLLSVEIKGSLNKGILGLTVAALGGLSVYYSIYFNFIFPYAQDHPYCYVHTADGMVRLVGDVKAYQSRHPKPRILVGVNSYWPLPFYFKEYEGLVAYPGDSKPEEYIGNYDIIIVDSKNTAEIAGFNKRYYRLSGVQESTTYFRTF